MKVPSYLDEVMEKQYYLPSDTKDFSKVIKRVVNYVTSKEIKLYDTDPEELERFRARLINGIEAKRWIPSTPYLMNAGTSNPMLLACFVLGVEDDIASIFKSLGEAAIIHKMGGGTGFDFSKIRARGTRVNSTNGQASGVLSFMSLFDCEANVIKQGGKRRAANLGSIRVDHPEILDFIDVKCDKKSFQNFNLSIQLPDWFMKKVTGKDPNPEYSVVDDQGKPTILTDGSTGFLNARVVFDTIVRNSWACAEPGVLFVDTINEDNPIPGCKITTTNPCGEIPLSPYEACNLASLNLTEFIDYEGRVDYALLDTTVRDVIRFMDDAIDASIYPIPKIEKEVKKNRKLGLGIMGLHGALIKAGSKYNSDRGISGASALMESISDSANIASIDLAKARGVPEGWSLSTYAEGPQTIEIRNLTRTCIAPTGTISMILDASSSGCEPIFAVVYKRTILGQTKNIVNSLFREIGEREGWLNEALIEKISNNGGRVTDISEVPEKWRNLFVTAGEIAPIDHIHMQVALQEFVDNSISKTVNMPESATIDQVRELLIYAWEQGCKGTSIYRDKSLTGVLNTDKKETPKDEDLRKSNDLGDTESTRLERGETLERPELLIGVTTKIQSGCGKLWTTINPYDGTIWEVFSNTGADGGCTANIQAISRLISSAARFGTPVEVIIDQLKSVKCARAIANPKCNVQSCSYGIAKQVEAFLKIYDKTEWDAFLNRLNEKLSDVPPSPEPAPDVKILSQEDILKISGCRSGKCD